MGGPATSVVVLPSVLVGASAYTGLAEAFRGLGLVAAVAAPPLEVRRGADVLETFRASVARARPDLVVAHSNAGLVAPAAAAGVPVVFVDAALPPPTGPGRMAPAALMARLEELADASGMLPPWTGWWDAEDVPPLFPDVATRRVVEADQPRLPLDYFRSEVASPPGWEGGAHAYLAFGGTYAGELGRARRLGWPTAVVDGARHLHHLHHPEPVARSVLALAAAATSSDDAGPHGPV
ncbi:hypothetical protein ACOCJ4_13245 [Knoellia sp. CPCC 206435]|uniref:hypothetical protein n=1 Tax=Knoellia terrae TaxID=3404797 RepID=UPI003B428C03